LPGKKKKRAVLLNKQPRLEETKEGGAEEAWVDTWGDDYDILNPKDENTVILRVGSEY